jgi:hypothetical protein
MTRWLPVLAICAGLTFAPRVCSQTSTSGAGAELEPIVRSALDTVSPPAAEFSSKIWRHKDATVNISKKMFEDAYDGDLNVNSVRKELRKNAQIELQHLSDLIRQLNTLNKLASCAYEINMSPELRGLANGASSEDEWREVAKTWRGVTDRHACASGRVAPSGGLRLSSLIPDPDVLASLNDVFLKIANCTNNIDKAIETKSRDGLAVSVSQLKSTVVLFYVVASVQVAKLTQDIARLANIKMGPDESGNEDDLVKELRQLIQNPFSDKSSDQP